MSSMNLKTHFFLKIWLLFMLVLPLYSQEQDDNSRYNKLINLSLEELMKIRVVSVSNIIEKLSETPAVVIVITKEDIIERGFQNLSQIFDELPGMDVVRVNNDISFKNYMRGYRNSFGTPYILLLDGLVWTDLYYNDTETIRAFPLSNINRVEIVYGPVSCVYGANAFTGVINVITNNTIKSNGSQLTGQISFGNYESVIADMNYIFKKDDFKLSLTSRIENGDDFPQNNNKYEWTKDKYLTNRKLWGGFLDSPAASGKKSMNRHRSVDIRGFFNNIEIGIQYYNLTSGYAAEYAFDKVLPNVIWTKTDYNIYGKYSHKINEHLNSVSVLRYFGSDVPNNSALAQGDNYLDKNGNLTRLINFELWQCLNTSWSFNQNFQYHPFQNTSISTGFEYEQKNLQKAYERTFGPLVSPDSLNAGTYQFPDPPSPTYKYQNRIITEDKAVYLNFRRSLNEFNFLHLGARYDHNSEYGGTTTIRAGYVFHLNKIIMKLLYGEGFQEPCPRVLYGGWQGIGSDPDLKPEKSKTIEYSINYTLPQLSQILSIYFVRNRNTILNFRIGGRNVGKRDIYGLDYHFKFQPSVKKLNKLKFWAYYSYIHTKGDEIYLENGDRYIEGEIGDIAPHKLSFGVTSYLNKYISATISGQMISSRNTVATNPIKKVDSFTLLNSNIRIKNIFAEGICLSFKVNNILNELYFHPGIRAADAGNTPGYFDENGVWHGSEGWLSSLLPQPDRTYLLTLELNFNN